MSAIDSVPSPFPPPRTCCLDRSMARCCSHFPRRQTSMQARFAAGDDGADFAMLSTSISDLKNVSLSLAKPEATLLFTPDQARAVYDERLALRAALASLALDSLPILIHATRHSSSSWKNNQKKGGARCQSCHVAVQISGVLTITGIHYYYVLIYNKNKTTSAS